MIPGVTGPPASTATVTFPGITDAARAEAECALQAARQVYHRRRVSWEMGPEGLAIARGDVVVLSHGLLDGGEAGRASGGTGSLTEMDLDRAIEIGRGDRILIRTPAGEIHECAIARHPDDPATGPVRRITLATPMAKPIDADGADPTDTLWHLFSADAEPAHLRITGIDPRGEDRIRLTAIDEVDDYYEGAGITIPERPIPRALVPFRLGRPPPPLPPPEPPPEPRLPGGGRRGIGSLTGCRQAKSRPLDIKLSRPKIKANINTIGHDTVALWTLFVARYTSLTGSRAPHNLPSGSPARASFNIKRDIPAGN